MSLEDDDINQSMEDLEQALAEVYLDDETTSSNSSDVPDGPSPDIQDSLEEPVSNRSLPKKRLVEPKVMFGVGLLAIIISAIPLLLFGLNGFSLTTKSESSSVVPPNDICSKAISLESGMLPLLASTQGAKRENDDDTETCGLNLSAGPGVWFKAVGTGVPFQLIKHDDQAFAHQVSVYQGECRQLTCVAGDDLKGAVLWNTLKDEQYYILVSGVNNAVGQFNLALEDVPEVPDEAAVNDMCDGAIGLATDGSISVATTEAATFDIDGAGSCYRAAHAGPGLWYYVIGTGRTLQASTNNPDTYIAVFSGGCETLQCVGASDKASGGATSVRWESQQATRYYILVHSAGTSKGTPFEISVTGDIEEEKSLVNDFCTGAIGPVASDGSILSGSTQYATLDSAGAGSCYEDDLVGNGIWYAVHGTGRTLRVATTETSSIEPLVTVFNGSCDNLECVESHNEVMLGEKTVVSWKSDLEETYYLLVRGIDNSRGPFELQVLSLADGQDPTVPVGDEETEAPLERPINDYCDSALQVPNDGSLTWATTENATIIMDGIGRCHSQKNNGPGIWFRASGTGKPLQASISTNSELDAFISVYSGDCEKLFCMADIDGDTRAKRNFVWDSSAEESYFVLVQGRFGQKGTFDLIIGEAVLASDAVPHDTCEGALGPIPTNGSIWSGTTDGATLEMEGLGTCYTEENVGVGVWYYVMGIGGPLELVAKGTSGFTPSMAVFSGSYCESLECISAGNAATGKAAVSTWQSQENVPYYVLVHGIGATSGSFDIEVLPGKEGQGEIEIDIIVDNDSCESPKTLSTSEDTILTATTENAEVSQITSSGSCSNAANTGPGRWYRIRGSGSPIKVYTRDLSSSEILLSVFAGSCDDLVCVNSDDDTYGANKNNGIWFTSQKDMDYYLHVHSVGEESGSFELTVEHEKDILDGAVIWDMATVGFICDTAAGPLSPSTPEISDNTASAAFSNENGLSCFSGLPGGPGSWFHVPGTGSPLMVTTTKTNTFNPLISVYTGSCSDSRLQCIDADFRSTASQNSAQWDSSSGSNYYILVHGVRDNGGAFSIKVHDPSAPVPSPSTKPVTPEPTAAVVGETTDVPTSRPTAASTPEPTSAVTSKMTESPTARPTAASTTSIKGDNDVCEDANGPLPRSSRHFGSLSYANVDDVGICGTASTDEPGIWYSVEGNGAGIRISTCKNFALEDILPDNTHTSVSVFRGGCSDLNCLVGSNNTCDANGVVNWNSEKGEIYHVLISGDEAAQAEPFVLLYDDTQWIPDNCLGESRDFIEKLSALQDFYYGTGNSGQAGPLSDQEWLTGCNPCSSWGGIDCDGDSRVTKLHLPEQSPALKGNLPESMEELKELVELDLSKNDLSGEIPKKLDKLKKLELLNLEGNSLTGELPKIGKMKDLLNINLRNNMLSGYLPDDFDKLRSIETINLGNNALTGPLPLSLGGMTSIRVLQLDHNQLSGAIPSEIGLLTQLQQLELHGNNFDTSSGIPPEICQLRNGSLTTLTADCGGDVPSVTCTCCTQCL